jgi:SUF system FeS cluster assembly, SufBD
MEWDISPWEVGSEFTREEIAIGSSDMDIVSSLCDETTDRTLPLWDILDLIDEYMSRVLHSIIEIQSRHTREWYIFTVDRYDISRSYSSLSELAHYQIHDSTLTTSSLSYIDLGHIGLIDPWQYLLSIYRTLDDIFVYHDRYIWLEYVFYVAIVYRNIEKARKKLIKLPRSPILFSHESLEFVSYLSICHGSDLSVRSEHTSDIFSHTISTTTTTTPPISYHRHIVIGAHTTFVGTGIMMDRIDIEIITEVVWDHVSSTLDLLALATDQSQISIEWVVRVSSPYRQVSIRVDQTNILIGTGARVRGVPRLEIATDDIEWGHSCRIHRLGGESLFYLTSRGLEISDAETLLLSGEIMRHLRTIDEEMRDGMMEEIEGRVRGI